MSIFCENFYFSLQILFSAYFSCSLKNTFEYPYYDMWGFIWIWLYLYICYLFFPKDFKIARFNTGGCDTCIKKTEQLVFIFEFSRVLYQWTWFFSMSKDCRDCALVLNFTWNHQQISHQNVFGAMLKVRPCVIDMWTILWRYLNNNKKTIMDKPLGVEFNSVENILL